MTNTRRRLLRLLKRDGYRCVVCGWQAKPNIVNGIEQRPGKLTVGHIVPRSRGGSDWLPNVQLECAPCNRAKKNHMPHELPGDLARTWENPAPAREGRPGIDALRLSNENGTRNKTVSKSPARPIELVLSDG